MEKRGIHTVHEEPFDETCSRLLATMSDEGLCSLRQSLALATSEQLVREVHGLVDEFAGQLAGPADDIDGILSFAFLASELARNTRDADWVQLVRDGSLVGLVPLRPRARAA